MPFEKISTLIIDRATFKKSLDRVGNCVIWFFQNREELRGAT